MDRNNKDVWVFIEHQGQKIQDVSLELIGKAAELAKDLNSRRRRWFWDIMFSR